MEKQVYTITEVQEMLQISRTAVYQFIGAVYQKQEPFIIVKPLTTKVASFLSLKQSSRTKPLSPDKTLADP